TGEPPVATSGESQGSVPRQGPAHGQEQLDDLLAAHLRAGTVEELSVIEADLGPRLAVEAALPELEVRHQARAGYLAAPVVVVVDALATQQQRILRRAEHGRIDESQDALARRQVAGLARGGQLLRRNVG